MYGIGMCPTDFSLLIPGYKATFYRQTIFAFVYIMKRESENQVTVIATLHIKECDYGECETTRNWYFARHAASLLDLHKTAFQNKV